MEKQKLWIEPVGSMIVARLRGVPTEEILKECQERILALVQDTGQGKVLYDTLEMEAPDIDLVLTQQKLQEELRASLADIKLRKAIVVPDSRIAYLSRIAFGEGNYRVFYSDLTAAIQWLEE
ncbi:MAG: hypothetical protein JWO49_3031 [Arthrobacter sp.]|nr:hypothetical protein [Arthrobacter sp.]MDB5743910.1 hypothetical protein [Polaromonas sp.]